MGNIDEREDRLAPSGLADALFTKTQQRVMAFLFGQPERQFFVKELITLTEGGSGAIQREIKRLAACGLIMETQMGKQKFYQANPLSPLFSELCSITLKTFGLLYPLKDALEPVASSIRVAFIYGSIAAQSDHSGSDVDLMVISDTLAYSDLFVLLEPVQLLLKRVINPTVLSVGAFRRKLEADNPFMRKIMERERIFVIGGEHELGS